MKNPMQKLRRFFVRSRTFNASAARATSHAPADDDEGGHRLSGAFIIVLILHVIAVVGVFAFARIKENRTASTPPQKTPVTTPASKTAPAKSSAAKAAAAAPAAAATQPAAPHESPKTAAPAHNVHVVKEGETLTKIAAAYSVNVPDLVSTNKLKSQDDIHKGQSLTIPAAKAAQKTPATAEVKPAQATAQKPAPAATDRKTAKTYMVKRGDSPVKIAREHGCSYEELMKLNNIKDPKKIQTGQVLKIPGKNG